jgi:hypothetical protein
VNRIIFPVFLNQRRVIDASALAAGPTVDHEPKAMFGEDGEGLVFAGHGATLAPTRRTSLLSLCDLPPENWSRLNERVRLI